MCQIEKSKGIRFGFFVDHASLLMNYRILLCYDRVMKISTRILLFLNINYCYFWESKSFVTIIFWILSFEIEWSFISGKNKFQYYKFKMTQYNHVTEISINMTYIMPKRRLIWYNYYNIICLVYHFSFWVFLSLSLFLLLFQVLIFIYFIF